MNLAKPTKVLILFFTFLPLIYMALFFVMFLFLVNGQPKGDPVFKHFGWFIAIHLGVMLLMFALLAFYVVFLFKTTAVRADLKALWAVVLFFGGPIAMPVFWYLYVWPSGTGAATPPAVAG
jgi:hypothetical protein